MIDLPTLGIIISSAAIDSINPFSVGALILLVSAIMGSGNSTRRLLALGSAYIFAMFITHLLAGLGLLYFFSEIPIIVAEYLAIVVGVLIMLVGILEIKDYFWYGKWVSLRIPTKLSDKIHNFTTSNATIWGAVALGVFVAVTGLAYAGAPYLAVVTILSLDFGLTAVGLIILYNLIFILPLVIVLVMVASGTKISSVAKWKEDSKGVIRLFTGLLLAFLSWIILSIANGAINFG